MDKMKNTVREAALAFYRKHGKEAADAKFVDYEVMARAAGSIKKDTDVLKVPPAFQQMVAAEAGILGEKKVADSALYVILKILLDHKGFDIKNIPNLTQPKGFIRPDAAVFPGYQQEKEETEKEEEEEKEEPEKEAEEEKEEPEKEEEVPVKPAAPTRTEAVKNETRTEQAQRVTNRVETLSETRRADVSPQRGSLTSNGRGESPAKLGASSPASPLSESIKKMLATPLTDTSFAALKRDHDYKRPPLNALNRLIKVVDSQSSTASPATSPAPAAVSPREQQRKLVLEAAQKRERESSPNRSAEAFRSYGGSRTRRALLRSIRATLKKNIK